MKALLLALLLSASGEVDNNDHLYDIPRMSVQDMSFSMGMVDTAGQMCEAYDTNEPFLDAIRHTYHEVYPDVYDEGVQQFVEMYDGTDEEYACRIVYEEYPGSLVMKP